MKPAESGGSTVMVMVMLMVMVAVPEFAPVARSLVLGGAELVAEVPESSALAVAGDGPQPTHITHIARAMVTPRTQSPYHFDIARHRCCRRAVGQDFSLASSAAMRWGQIHLGLRSGRIPPACTKHRRTRRNRLQIPPVPERWPPPLLWARLVHPMSKLHLTRLHTPPLPIHQKLQVESAYPRVGLTCLWGREQYEELGPRASRLSFVDDLCVNPVSPAVSPTRSSKGTSSWVGGGANEEPSIAGHHCGLPVYRTASFARTIAARTARRYHFVRARRDVKTRRAPAN